MHLTHLLVQGLMHEPMHVHRYQNVAVLNMPAATTQHGHGK